LKTYSIVSISIRSSKFTDNSIEGAEEFAFVAATCPASALWSD
jgi:hypothetical protein